jgi:proliferating cell nuclear antigen
MRISIVGTTLFEVVKAVKDLVSEVRFEMDSKELRLTCMDPANVAMVILRMPSSSCTEWDVPTDETGFGVNISNLATILKRGAKEDDITTLETKDSKLLVNINRYRKFTVPMIDVEEKPAKIPELNFKATVDVDLDALKSAIGDTLIVGDSAWFEVTKANKFIVSAEGDLSKAHVEFNDELATVKADQRAKSKYSLEYLEKMAAAVKTDKVKVELMTDYPLRLSFNTKTFSVKYILAPRVDDENDYDKDEKEEAPKAKTPAKPQTKVPANQNKSKPTVEEQEEEVEEEEEINE